MEPFRQKRFFYGIVKHPFFESEGWTGSVLNIIIFAYPFGDVSGAEITHFSLKTLRLELQNTPSKQAEQTKKPIWKIQLHPACELSTKFSTPPTDQTKEHREHLDRKQKLERI